MPNRIIRESAKRSDTLAELSGDEERCFWRLTIAADDYGRFDGRAAIVRAECFQAMIEKIATADVEAWIAALVQVGLIQRYAVEGKPYLQFVNWKRHQGAPRAKESKYPHPVADVSAWAHMIADARKPEQMPAATENQEVGVCEQMRADVPVSVSESVSECGVGAETPRPPQPSKLPERDEGTRLGRYPTRTKPHAWVGTTEPPREIAWPIPCPDGGKWQWARFLMKALGGQLGQQDRWDTQWQVWCHSHDAVACVPCREAARASAKPVARVLADGSRLGTAEDAQW